MAYFRFFLTHPRVLSFGLLLTLFSSFGQTFLISIFVPRLLECRRSSRSIPHSSARFTRQPHSTALAASSETLHSGELKIYGRTSRVSLAAPGG